MAKSTLYEQSKAQVEYLTTDVKLLGKIRGGDDDYGNQIMSMDVDDDNKFRINEFRIDKDGKQEKKSSTEIKKLREGVKRIVFVTEAVAKHYMEHSKANVEKQTFPCPIVEPDERNAYWIRRIYPE